MTEAILFQLDFFSLIAFYKKAFKFNFSSLFLRLGSTISFTLLAKSAKWP